MPCRRSTLGWLAQSLQTMRCVRLVTGALALGKLVANEPSWLLNRSSSEEGVQSWQLELTGCSASSKPADWYWASFASVSGVSGYMYDDARTHSQSATEQPALSKVLRRSKYA